MAAVKVMFANGNPFVLALMDALGLPATTQWFELRCARDEAVAVRCAYLPRADATEGFDARPLLANYRLVPASKTTQGDPAEALLDEDSKLRSLFEGAWDAGWAFRDAKGGSHSDSDGKETFVAHALRAASKG